MDAQIKAEEIVRNNDYTLQLSTQGTAITLKLTIKICKLKTDVYQITLNSLNDVVGLSEQFSKAELFLNYIRDPNNIQVNLQIKTIVVVQYNARKCKIIQLASLPLQLVNSIQKKPEQELVEIILERCSSKVQLSGQEIKSFFENIAICLGQNIKNKKQNKTQILTQEEQIRNLEDQINGNWAKCQERSHIKQQRINKLEELELKFENNFMQTSQNIDKTSKQVRLYCENQIANMLSSHNKKISEKMANMEQQWGQNRLIMKENLQKQLDRSEVNKKQMKQLNKALTNKVNKQIEEIKKSLERDVNVLGHRLQKVEKILQKMESSLKENTQKIQKVDSSVNYLDKKRDIAKNWVDPECCSFNNLVLSRSTITTAQSGAYVFGKEKLVGQCQFTVKFTKIGMFVGLGISDTQNKDKSDANWNNSRVSYYSFGDCYVSDKRIGNFGSGFKVGQTVTVAIDMNKGSIQWEVERKVSHKLTNEILKDKNITWVPFIYLNNSDDSFELIE